MLVLFVDPLNQEASYGRDRPEKLREWMCDCQHHYKEFY